MRLSKSFRATQVWRIFTSAKCGERKVKEQWPQSAGPWACCQPNVEADTGQVARMHQGSSIRPAAMPNHRPTLITMGFHARGLHRWQAGGEPPTMTTVMCWGREHRCQNSFFQAHFKPRNLKSLHGNTPTTRLAPTPVQCFAVFFLTVP